MSNWSLYNGDDYNWEVQVSHMEATTYLHDNEWAEHLENLGWAVCRWHYQQNGKSIVRRIVQGQRI